MTPHSNAISGRHAGEAHSSGEGLAIELRNVTLSLKRRDILRGITFHVAPGEVVGVLGPNGAGKTTLMRALLGLVPISAGTLLVGGNAPSRGDMQIGYMPQARSAGMFPRLSGHAFVAAAVRGERWGLPRLDIAGREEVDRVIRLAGAMALADRPIEELSGGQRQRLLLAQALVGRPRLLLLDEPLASLDPRSQREVVRLVRSLQRELGVTILFSAHELNPLLGQIDRVLLLGSGRAALGTVEEVVTGPILSLLYGTRMEVARVNGRIFVTPLGEDDAPLEARAVAAAPHGPPADV